MEKHHIVFKSQGGLDFELNYKYLSSEDHRGNDGPHLNRETDLRYKRELESTLRMKLFDNYYTVEALIEILGLNSRQAHKAFNKVAKYRKGMKREDIIRRLMGGKLYG